MNQQLQNQYFQQMPPQQPYAPHPTFTKPDEAPPAKEVYSLSIFWLVFGVFVLVGLALFAFYSFFLEPILSKMRTAILSLQKREKERETEVTEEYKEGAKDAIAYMKIWKPAKTEFQSAQQEAPHEEVLEEETEATLMMPETLDDRFMSINEKYGLVDKSLMNDLNKG